MTDQRRSIQIAFPSRTRRWSGLYRPKGRALMLETTGLSAILLPSLRWPGALLIFVQCICVVAIIAILESRDV